MGDEDGFSTTSAHSCNCTNKRSERKEAWPAPGPGMDFPVVSMDPASHPLGCARPSQYCSHHMYTRTGLHLLKHESVLSLLAGMAHLHNHVGEQV